MPWEFSLSREARGFLSLDLSLRVFFFFSFPGLHVNMADEVIDGLGNMKLTSEEEEIIPISDEGRVEAIESCTLSLLGKFLTCKPFNKRAAKITLKRVWGLEDRMHITEVGPNLFQFKFQSEFDMSKVLGRGPWSFDNQLLLLHDGREG